MQLSFTKKKNIRKSFGKLKESLSIPNLIEVQKNSYNEFLNSKSLNEQLNDLSKGIDKVFKSIFLCCFGVSRTLICLFALLMTRVAISALIALNIVRNPAAFFSSLTEAFLEVGLTIPTIRSPSNSSHRTPASR